MPPVIVPPVVYLPTTEGLDGSVAIVRTLTDGRRGLLAYTALDRLADRCGPNQPWALVRLSQLGHIKDDQPFDVVAFDLVVPRSQIEAGRIR